MPYRRCGAPPNESPLCRAKRPIFNTDRVGYKHGTMREGRPVTLAGVRGQVNAKAAAAASGHRTDMNGASRIDNANDAPAERDGAQPRSAEVATVTGEDPGRELATLSALRAESDAANARFDALFQSAPFALFFHRHDGTIVRANHAAGTLLGRPAAELVNRHPHEVEQYEILDGLNDAVTQAWRAMQPMANVPVRLTRADGEVRDVIKQ